MTEQASPARDAAAPPSPTAPVRTAAVIPAAGRGVRLG
ncbi:2-C-methyl-D-erythritol 4-phosphate cytidylyltransferase, partial [Streptomyces sp. NEAU-H3]|nr:2-C-methyl-D-erythritol 4-phosphate cytidylyltransferase [Streptomyces sp. NEAU-H3]